MEIKKEDIKCDFHTRTVKSDNCYSTLLENINRSNECGIKYIVVSDMYKGVVDREYIVNKSEIRGVGIIRGVEVDLCSKVDYSLLRDIPIRIGVIRSERWLKHHDITDMVELIIDNIKSGNINVVGHPEYGINKLKGGVYSGGISSAIKEYYNWLVKYSKDNKVFLELNEYTLGVMDIDSEEYMMYMISKCKENNNPIVIGSNSYISDDIGEYGRSIEILNSVGYKKELVINTNERICKGLMESI